jgi:hypothetical protein
VGGFSQRFSFAMIGHKEQGGGCARHHFPPWWYPVMRLQQRDEEWKITRLPA